MSFFKKMLASVGVGNTKIDAILDNAEVCAGDILKGHISIKGGKVEQEIRSIDMIVRTEYYTIHENEEGEESEERHIVDLARQKVGDALTVQPGEQFDVDFEIEIPADTPVTFGKFNVWVTTEADVSMALDPSDKDELIVQPHYVQGVVMDAMETLGFQIAEIDLEEAPSALSSRMPFVQEIEYIASSGPFAGKLDEVEVIFGMYGDHARIFFEVDKKGTWLSEALGIEDEVKRYIDVSYDDEDVTVENMVEFIGGLVGRIVGVELD